MVALRHRRNLTGLALVLGTLIGPPVINAAEPLGLYAGGAIGRARVDTGNLEGASPSGGVFSFGTYTENHSALALPGVGTCAINNPNCAWFTRRDSVTNTRVAARAGAQFKLGAWALRAEYERFNVAGGNPGLASLAATWTR
jgi:hypothetical protein